MDKVIKVVSAKKKFIKSTTTTTATTTTTSIDAGNQSLSADYVNGFILAHLDPESKSKALTEKNLVGNRWSALVGEILDDDDDNVKKDDDTINNDYFKQTSNTIPFLLQRTPSPVSVPVSGSSRNTFQARAPSPRKERKKYYT